MPPSDSDQQARGRPWQPDGWGWRGRLGLLLPHADIEPDAEFATLAPEGVSTHAMRVPWPRVAGQDALTRARAFADPPRLDDAAETLAALRPQAIAFCFTSSSYVLGPDGDVALKARLETRTQGIPVAITGVAAVAALHMFGARRIALMHPPWFTDDMDPRGAAYFHHQGFEVVSHARAPLRPDRGQIHPGPLYEWARGQVPREADAVFVGGNGMRTIGAIQALEEALGRPVLTSNQVVCWQALHLAHIAARVERYGQLFDYTPPGPQP